MKKRTVLVLGLLDLLIHEVQRKAGLTIVR